MSPLLPATPQAAEIARLFYVDLIIAGVIFVVVAGIVTCCIGWILLVIPYIGIVVTLPIWYWLRAFSVEFLAQFQPGRGLEAVQFCQRGNVHPEPRRHAR